MRARPADYQHEFALARQIENARARTNAALSDAKRLHAALMQRAAKADSGLKTRLLAFDGILMRQTALPPDDPHDITPEGALPPGSLSGLEYGFSKLAEAVDGADGAPTPDAESGFRQRAQSLANALVQWSSLKGQIDGALKQPAARKP